MQELEQLIARWTWEATERPGGGHRVTKTRDAARRAAFHSAAVELAALTRNAAETPVSVLRALVERWQTVPAFAEVTAGEFAPLMAPERLEQERSLGAAIGFANAAADLAATLPAHHG